MLDGSVRCTYARLQFTYILFSLPKYTAYRVTTQLMSNVLPYLPTVLCIVRPDCRMNCSIIRSIVLILNFTRRCLLR